VHKMWLVDSQESLKLSPPDGRFIGYGGRDLDTTSKQRSRSFILVPIDFSYTTSYRLSIVTFALGRTYV